MGKEKKSTGCGGLIVIGLAAFFCWLWMYNAGLTDPEGLTPQEKAEQRQNSRPEPTEQELFEQSRKKAFDAAFSNVRREILNHLHDPKTAKVPRFWQSRDVKSAIAGDNPYEIVWVIDVRARNRLGLEVLQQFAADVTIRTEDSGSELQWVYSVNELVFLD